MPTVRFVEIPRAGIVSLLLLVLASSGCQYNRFPDKSPIVLTDTIYLPVRLVIDDSVTSPEDMIYIIQDFNQANILLALANINLEIKLVELWPSPVVPIDSIFYFCDALQHIDYISIYYVKRTSDYSLGLYKDKYVTGLGMYHTGVVIFDVSAGCLGHEVGHYLSDKIKHEFGRIGENNFMSYELEPHPTMTEQQRSLLLKDAYNVFSE